MEFALVAGACGECADVAHDCSFLWKSDLGKGLGMAGILSKTFHRAAEMGCCLQSFQNKEINLSGFYGLIALYRELMETLLRRVRLV